VDQVEPIGEPGAAHIDHYFEAEVSLRTLPLRKRPVDIARSQAETAEIPLSDRFAAIVALVPERLVAHAIPFY
jgi:hypothetical protein